MLQAILSTLLLFNLAFGVKIDDPLKNYDMNFFAATIRNYATKMHEELGTP